jgi:hypothetical protein
LRAPQAPPRRSNEPWGSPHHETLGETQRYGIMDAHRFRVRACGAPRDASTSQSVQAEQRVVDLVSDLVGVLVAQALAASDVFAGFEENRAGQ